MSKNSEIKTNKTAYEKNHAQENRKDTCKFPSVQKGYEYTAEAGETHIVYKDGIPVKETVPQEIVDFVNQRDGAEYYSDINQTKIQIKLQKKHESSQSKCGKKEFDGLCVSNYAIMSKSIEEIIVNKEQMREKKLCEMRFFQMAKSVARQVLSDDCEYEMFCLCYMGDKKQTQESIGKRYGVSASTVNRRLKASCEKVRGEFIKEHSKTEILSLLGNYYHFMK